MHEHTVTHSKVYLKCVHVNEQNQIQTPSGFYLLSTNDFMKFLSVYIYCNLLVCEFKQNELYSSARLNDFFGVWVVMIFNIFSYCIYNDFTLICSLN